MIKDQLAGHLFRSTNCSPMFSCWIKGFGCNLWVAYWFSRQIQSPMYNPRYREKQNANKLNKESMSEMKDSIFSTQLLIYDTIFLNLLVHLIHIFYLTFHIYLNLYLMFCSTWKQQLDDSWIPGLCSVLVWSTKNQTRGLVSARQVLYHIPRSP